MLFIMFMLSLSHYIYNVIYYIVCYGISSFLTLSDCILYILYYVITMLCSVLLYYCSGLRSFKISLVRLLSNSDFRFLVFLTNYIPNGYVFIESLSATQFYFVPIGFVFDSFIQKKLSS